MDKELKEYLDNEFGKIGRRFDRIGRRFDRIDRRFDRIEANTDTLLDLVVEQSNKDRSEVQKNIDAAVVLMGEQNG